MNRNASYKISFAALAAAIINRALSGDIAPDAYCFHW